LVYQRGRLIGENQQLKAEVAMLKEELRIKDTRLYRIPAASRPHYPPTERLAILALKAMRGWNNTQAAKAFHVCDATIAIGCGSIRTELIQLKSTRIGCSGGRQTGPTTVGNG
jgi:predicted RNA polymerase sigma factor